MTDFERRTEAQGLDKTKILMRQRILLLSITTTMDPALIDQGNLLKRDWPIIRGMILRINLVQNYSSKFGNSQQQFTVTDGGCK